MDREVVKRFGGSWVCVVEDSGCFNYGWLRAIDKGCVILTHRRAGKELPGKKASRMRDIISIGNI